MLARTASKLTYANVMATIAVVLALGGGAYAISLPKNSVKSKQIKNGAVGNLDLRADAVDASKVLDASLGGAELQDGAVNGAKVQDGTLLAGDIVSGEIAAAAVAGGDVQPVNNPLNDVVSATVTTKRPGALLAFGYVRARLACGVGGPCDDTYGLYVDNVRVPNSGTFVQTTSGDGPITRDLFLAGVSATVGPGPHTVKLSFQPGLMTNNSSTSQDARVGALQLGP